MQSPYESGEVLKIEHRIMLDLEQKPIKLKLKLIIDEIEGRAVYSGPAGYALRLIDTETIQEQLITLSRLGHETIVAYNWYIGLDPNENNKEKSIEEMKELIAGAEGEVVMTSRNDLTTPENFATRFLNTLHDLEPAYNEVLEALFD